MSAELLSRMEDLFRRTLEAERAEVPTRDSTGLQIADIHNEFPELTEDEAGELALLVLQESNNWFLTSEPLRSDRGRLMGIWFTDRAGYRRLQGLDLA